MSDSSNSSEDDNLTEKEKESKDYLTKQMNVSLPIYLSKGWINENQLEERKKEIEQQLKVIEARNTVRAEFIKKYPEPKTEPMSFDPDIYRQCKYVTKDVREVIINFYNKEVYGQVTEKVYPDLFRDHAIMIGQLSDVVFQYYKKGLQDGSAKVKFKEDSITKKRRLLSEMKPKEGTDYRCARCGKIDDHYLENCTSSQRNWWRDTPEEPKKVFMAPVVYEDDYQVYK